MAAVLYTTTDSIRAAIGVTDAEVNDSQILSLGIVDQLILYLDDVYPTYEALASQNAVGQTPTVQQQKDWKKLKLLCQYAAAVIVLQAGQNLLAQTVSEGGTSMARFSVNDIDTTLNRLIGIRDGFVTSLASVDPVVANLPNLFAVVSPSFDPVVGDSGNT